MNVIILIIINLFSHKAGNQKYLRDCFDLSSKKIVETIEVDFNKIIGAKS